MFNQLSSVWSNLSVMSRLGAVAGLSLVFVTVVLLFQIGTAPGQALLYGNLDAAQAGEVITELDRRGVRYQVRGNSVYVAETQRDELRISLAGQGLPKNSGAGYELLDKLTGFGTTSQMFDAAYARAIEGELARTIMASAFVRDARVHIARVGSSPFQANQTASASVFVKPTAFELSEENARALKFLVASAVAGLESSNVTVIDSSTGKVIEEIVGNAGTNRPDPRTAGLETNALNLLEAHVGRGNAKVKINIEAVSQTETIFERRFDPEGRVAVSSDTQEINRSNSGPSGGAVTVASNVPGGDANGNPNISSSQDAEIRERLNYEVSEVQREVQKTAGDISRLSVAVLVNGVHFSDENDETQWRPRGDEELEDLRELVQSAVGFRAERGDEITIKSLQFSLTPVDATGPDKGLFDVARLNPMTLIQLGVLSFVALAIGLFVVRPIFLSPRPGSSSEIAELEEYDDLGAVALSGEEAVGVSDAGGTLEQLPELAPLGDFSAPMAVVDDFGVAEAEDTESVERLKKVIESRQPDTVEILRNWLEDQRKEEEFA